MLKLVTVILVFSALIGILIADLSEIPPTASRILGGIEVPMNAYPYIVSVQEKGNHFCSGIILDQYQILTTARCASYLYDMSKLKVVVGYLNSTCITCGAVAYAVLTRIAHYNYNPITLENNIGLLKLEDPIEFGKNIQPAPPISAIEAKTGQTVFAVGWGWNIEAKDVLKKLPTTVQKNDVCITKYRKRQIVTKDNLCTLTFPGEGNCNGDDGSALVNRKNELVAMASFNESPCNAGLPDLYTKLYVYKEWIQEYTQEI